VIIKNIPTEIHKVVSTVGACNWCFTSSQPIHTVIISCVDVQVFALVCRRYAVWRQLLRGWLRRLFIFWRLCWSILLRKRTIRLLFQRFRIVDYLYVGYTGSSPRLPLACTANHIFIRYMKQASAGSWKMSSA